MRASSRIPLWLQCLLLALLVGGVFSPVLSFEFLRWDDDIAVTQNELVQAELSGELITRWFQSDQALRFKPVHWLSGWLWYQGFGLNSGAWHGFNLLLHLFVAVGFFVLLRQILQRWAGEASAAEMDGVAWLGTAIWALHPLRVEPVAWVTASTYLMATGWLILSFALYLRAHGGSESRGRRWSLFGAWVAAVLAYGTYPITVTYGLLLLVVDGGALRCIPRWRTKEFWRWVVKIAAFLVPAGVALAATIWVRYFDVGIFTDAPDLERVGLGERGLVALAMVGALAGRLVWFVNLTPNVSPMELSGGNLGMLLAMAGVTVAGLGWMWFNRRRSPMMIVVVGAFGAIALPCLGLTERATWPVDRYTYLSHLVLITGLAVATLQLWRRVQTERAMVMVGGVGLLALAMGSWRQLPMWANSSAFFEALTTHPSFGDNVRQDGHVLLLWSRHAASEGDEQRMNQLRAQALQVYLNGIRMALNQADFNEAVQLMSHIEHHFDATAEMNREKAAWLIELGRYDEAKHSLLVSLSIKPNDERALALLAQVEADLNFAGSGKLPQGDGF